MESKMDLDRLFLTKDEYEKLLQQRLNKFKMFGYTIFRNVKLELFWNDNKSKKKNYNKKGTKIFRPSFVCFDYVCLKQAVGIQYELELFSSIEISNYVTITEDELNTAAFYNGVFSVLFHEDKGHCWVNPPKPQTNFNEDAYRDTVETLTFLSGSHKAVDGDISVNQPEDKRLIAAIEDSSSHKIAGGAGSGKSYSIVWMAAKYVSEHPSSQVLIITYNKTLIRKIRHLLNETALDFNFAQIKVTNYHQLDPFKPSEYPGNFKDDEKWYFRVDDLQKEYDLILVDESQDYHINCLKNLKDYCNKIIFMGDSQQNIYEHNSCDELQVDKNNEQHKYPVAPVPGKWMTLEKIYRLSNKNNEVATKLKKTFFEKELIHNQLDLFSGLTDFLPYKIFTIRKNNDLAKLSLIKEILLSGINIEHTSILLFSIENKIGLIRQIVELVSPNIKIVSMYPFDKANEELKDSYKLAFDSYSSALKFSTIKSFKGLEDDNIILIIEDEYNKYKIIDIQDVAFELLVGVTRAKKKLFIVSENISFNAWVHASGLRFE